MRKLTPFLFGMTLPVAAVAPFMWHSEQTASQAMDLQFLRVCDGQWQTWDGFEQRCVLKLTDSSLNLPKSAYEFEPLLNVATTELRARGWVKEEGFFRHPESRGKIEIREEEMLSLEQRDFYMPKVLIITVHPPESPWR